MSQFGGDAVEYIRCESSKFGLYHHHLINTRGLGGLEHHSLGWREEKEREVCRERTRQDYCSMHRHTGNDFYLFIRVADGGASPLYVHVHTSTCVGTYMHIK